jgi:hypothetical protein
MISKQSFNRFLFNFLTKQSQKQQQNKRTLIKANLNTIENNNKNKRFLSNLVKKKPINVKNSKFFYVSSFVFGTALGVTASNLTETPDVENDLVPIENNDNELIKKLVSY